ncbi:MAG TPA: hypothetical protein VD963_01460, partial [Phycisphaerales bacterium]|nr:hypothetical protein [Phycisphaerales bacterium]
MALQHDHVPRVERIAAGLGGEQSDLDPLGERGLRLRAPAVGVELLRLHRHRHVPPPVRAPDRRGLVDAQVVEGDALEQVGDQRLLLRRLRLGAQGRDQVERAREGRAPKPVPPQQRPERPVDRVLAQPLLQQVHGERALAVRDVVLPGHAGEGRLLGSVRAALQVPVQLELQVAAEMVLAAELLHHHLRGILGEGLGEHLPPLHVRADHLVRPVLVRQLVCGEVRDVVHRLRLVVVGDEAHVFRIGDRAGERLREVEVARELDDPGVVERIGTEVRLVVVERGRERVEHAIYVPRVAGVVVDGEVDAGVAAV